LRYLESPKQVSRSEEYPSPDPLPQGERTTFSAQSPVSPLPSAGEDKGEGESEIKSQAPAQNSWWCALGRSGLTHLAASMVLLVVTGLCRPMALYFLPVFLVFVAWRNVRNVESQESRVESHQQTNPSPHPLPQGERECGRPSPTGDLAVSSPLAGEDQGE